MEDEDFEWDDAKAAQNLASHGVSFEAAQLAFDDPFAVVREDRRQDYGEDRYIPTRHGPGPPTGRLSRAARRASADHLGPIGRTTGTTTLP
jgi:Ribonuclease toxin, BrnT, of type II toxin-antitoxin system